MTPVTVRIIAIHGTGAEAVRTETICDGKRYEKDGCVILRYTETIGDSVEADRVVTTLTVGEDVRMHRKGNPAADMLFLQEYRHAFIYPTPYGTIPMELETKRLEIKRDERRLTVHLTYTVFSDGAIASEAELVIDAY